MWVKICGVTTEDDALLAAAVGASAVGFVFAPSPRQVAAGRVAEIVRRLPAEVVPVGVFRDSLPERVVEVALQAGLRAVQLHGNESPEACALVAEKVPMVIKAFASGDPRISDAAGYPVDAVLVDAPAPGSGEVFDWRLAESVPGVRRLVLAGGLTPENVAEAIAKVRPWGVDVSSGVESSPGHKDPRKVLAFVQAARAADPGGYEPAGDGPYDWQVEP
jgi:phosphoribosylanthranilate isomerase